MQDTEMSETRHFMTVEWCGNGKRGVFCDSSGRSGCCGDNPLTTDEMREALGPFWMILDPKSEEMTEEKLGKYTNWTSLEEYSNVYGIALKEDITNREEE